MPLEQLLTAAGSKPGADLRLAAAQALQDRLKLFLAGEPPYDLFVRWKPLCEQAIGWNPSETDLLHAPPSSNYTIRDVRTGPLGSPSLWAQSEQHCCRNVDQGRLQSGDAHLAASRSWFG
jgi:hypothetical protein